MADLTEEMLAVLREMNEGVTAIRGSLRELEEDASHIRSEVGTIQSVAQDIDQTLKLYIREDVASIRKAVIDSAD